MVIPFPFDFEIFSPFSSKKSSYAKPDGLVFPINLIILVEDTLANALSFKYLPHISKKIKVTPEYIFHNVRMLIQKYPHIQFLFVNGRKESKRVIQKIFFSGCAYKKIDLQYAYDQKVL